LDWQWFVLLFARREFFVIGSSDIISTVDIGTTGWQQNNVTMQKPHTADIVPTGSVPLPGNICAIFLLVNSPTR
jgi:hypothetical protein